jgi:hypothetical protein
MTPFFTILVPVYNHERFVGLALDSLLAQTDPDWEACVSDDGSTDGTPAILDDYARRDPRIRVFHKANGGEASALNAAWREARGTWINWLSSDDLFLPDKLAIQREWIAHTPACRYFFTDFQTLDDATGTLKDGYAAHTPSKGMELVELLGSNYINGIAMCVHREVFETVGAFDEISRHGQDYDFHLRAVARYAPIRIPKVTCVQRTHPGQLSRQRTQAMFYDCAAAAVRNLKTLSPEALLGRPRNLRLQEMAPRIDRLLSVAASPNSYSNLLGAHPLILMQLLTWVGLVTPRLLNGRRLLNRIGHNARSIAWTGAQPQGIGQWQALSVLCDTASLPVTCAGNVEVKEVLEAAWCWNAARGLPAAGLLADYAGARYNLSLMPRQPRTSATANQTVWIPVVRSDPASREGAERLAHLLAGSGIQAVILGRGKSFFGWNRGVLTIQAPHLTWALMALAATPGHSVLVMPPRQEPSFWWRHLWPVVRWDDPDEDAWAALTQHLAQPVRHRGAGRKMIALVARCVRRVRW